MRHWFVLIRQSGRLKLAVSVATAIVLGVWWGWVTASGAGLLVLDSNEVSVVGDEDEESYVVSLKNSGRGQLRVVDVKSSCGCTVAKPLDSPMILPGKESSLHLAVTIPEIGEKHAEVTILTDSVKTPTATVTLKLKSDRLKLPILTSELGRILAVCSTAEGVASTIREVQTWEKVGSSPWIVGLESSDPKVVCSIDQPMEKVLSTGVVTRNYRLHVEAPVGGEVGRAIAYPVKLITTSNQESEKHRGVVYAEFIPKVRVIPERLIVNRHSTAIVQRRIVLLASDEMDWTVELEGAVPGWISVEQTAKEFKKTRQVILNAAIDVSRAAATDAVTAIGIRTGIDDIPVVRIPVQFE